MSTHPIRPWRCLAIAAALASVSVWAGPAAATASAGGNVPPQWQPPLKAPIEVVRGFDAPDEPWEPGHRGVDLAALPGSIVVAASDGWVSFAGSVAGRGVMSLDHPIGSPLAPVLRTTYEPIEAAVAEGDQVRRGQIIGTVQDGGSHCLLTCLHWGLRDLAAEAEAERARGPYADAPIYRDPLALLTRARIRLLPRFQQPAPASTLPLPGSPRPIDSARSGTVAPPKTAPPDSPHASMWHNSTQQDTTGDVQRWPIGGGAVGLLIAAPAAAVTWWSRRL